MNDRKQTKTGTSLPRIFELIKKIEQTVPVDSIKLTDGTKIWNLVRVLLYFYPQKHHKNTKKETPLKTSYQNRLQLLATAGIGEKNDQ